MRRSAMPSHVIGIPAGAVVIVTGVPRSALQIQLALGLPFCESITLKRPRLFQLLSQCLFRDTFAFRRTWRSSSCHG
jgi:hypothetical protein